MPFTGTITSKRTGQNYPVTFQQPPNEADIDEAADFFDKQAAQQAGVDAAVLEQKPLGTFANEVRNIGPQVLDQSVGGLAKLNEAAGRSPLAAMISPLGLANQATQMITGFNPLAKVAETTEVIRQEGERLRPVNPFNETARTVGGAVNQVGGMIATGGLATAAGMAPARAMSLVPSVMGFAAGAGQGVDTAREMGITSPTAQAGMGAAFGGVEALTEKIGGIGGNAVERFIRPSSVLGRLTLNTASESGEEILAGRAQDALTVGAGQFVSDPSRPGFTRTGFELPSLNPLDPRTLAKMKQEAIGGAAGGVIFSGLQGLANRGQVSNELPTNQTPGAPAGAAAAAPVGGVAATTDAPEGHAGDLTLSEVADLTASPDVSVTKGSGPTADQTAQMTSAPGAGSSPAAGSEGVGQPLSNVGQPLSGPRVVSTGKPNGAQVAAVIDFVEAADLEPLLLREVGDDQTRDRANNRASAEQITSIATAPDAQLLGDSPVSSMGAPVVDDVILAGNGRAEGLLQGYKGGGAGIGRYRDEVVRQAAAQGRPDVAAMKQPVMIRRVTNYLRGDRRSFVTESNPKYSTLQETVAEAALLDAEVLGDMSGIEFTQSGQLTSSSLQQVATKLKAAQRGVNATTGGKPDVVEGTRRVQLASLAKLAKDNGVDVAELSGLLETDVGRRAVAEVSKAAPRLAALDADLGLGDVMLSALRSFSEGARAVSQGIFKNLTEWADNRGQELIRDELSPEAGQLLEIMIETVRTPTKLRELFETYLEDATNEQDQRNQAAGSNDIFGDARRNVAGRQILRRQMAAGNDTSPAPAQASSGQGDGTVAPPADAAGVGQEMSDPFGAMMQGTESTRPRNRGETDKAQAADPLAELQAANLAGQANQDQGRMEPLMSPAANRLGRGLADLMPPPRITHNTQPLTLNLSTAYTRAARGQSTAMIPLADVFNEARKDNPALTREAFAAQVRADYEAGTLMLEGANSQAEADAAGLRIDSTPVGSAVRMAVVPGLQSPAGMNNPAPVSQSGAVILSPKADAVLPAIESVDSFQSAPERPATARDYNQYGTAQSGILKAAELRRHNALVKFQEIQHIERLNSLQHAERWLADMVNSMPEINLDALKGKEFLYRGRLSRVSDDGQRIGPADQPFTQMNSDPISWVQLPLKLQALRERFQAELTAAEAALYLAQEADGGRADRLAAKESAAEWERQNKTAAFAALLDARDDEAKNAATTFLGKVWSAFAEHDEVFQYGKTTSTDLNAIASAVSVPGKPVSMVRRGDAIIVSGKEGSLTIYDADTPRPYIRSTDAKSQGKEGGGGSQLYAAALDWIHNSGKRIKDDSGLTSINAIRRTSNFLASALRWGTTVHLKPHVDQKIKWGKSDVRNIAAMATKEMEHAFKSIASARQWVYDFSNGEFRDESGNNLTRAELAAAVQMGDPAKSGIGLSTLQRAIITNSAIGAFERGETAADVLGASERGIVPVGVLYSSAQIAADQARNEGVLKELGLPTKAGTRVWGKKPVAAALRKIAADSTQPATMRFMARLLGRMDLGNLLLRIEADGRLNYAGQYQPMGNGRGEIALNTRVLSRGMKTGQGDVRESLVHEVLHHVTYNVLRNPKTAAQKAAKAALESLRKRALSALAVQEQAGQFDYELSNLDEFISALFTRADFQTALAGIPVEQAPKSLGQRVRSMLDEIFRKLAELVTGREVPEGSVIEASFANALRLIEEPGTGVAGPSLLSRIHNAVMTQGPGMVTIQPRDLRSVKAYHGTPHKVDQFSTSKIGTGEGAQAYGWGLYFAEDKTTAKHYSDILGKAHSSLYLGGKLYDGRRQNLDSDVDMLIADAWHSLPRTYRTKAEMLNELKSRSKQAFKEWKGRYKEAIEKAKSDFVQVEHPGNLYTVELLPDESEFLDWDKPLAEQSEKVKAALAGLPESPGDIQQAIDLLTPRTTLGGRQAGLAQKQIDQLKVRLGNVNAASGAQFYNRLGEAKTASDMLGQAGIPGIKYLDAGSRSAGDGSRNFVVFDEKHIRITHENGQEVPSADWLGGATRPEALQSPAFTGSRLASPDEAQNVYDPITTAQMQANANAWLDANGLEAGVVAMEQNAAAGLEIQNMPALGAEVITRLTAVADNGGEVDSMQANTLLDRASRAWHGRASQQAGQTQQQRSAATNALLPIMPVLTAKELLVDRGKRIVGGRFEGGEGGATKKIKDLMTRIKAMLPNLLNNLRVKLYPGMTWADIFMDMPDNQKERQREIYRRLMLDERLKALTPEERVALTNELDKAWQRERRKVFKQELQKAGVLGEKAATDRKKVEKALPKLLRLLNLGMMNSEMFREAIAPEYGVRTMTAADGKRLRDLFNQAYKLPPGIRRNEVLMQGLVALQRVTGVSKVDMLNNFWVASVLSGPQTLFDTLTTAASGGLFDTFTSALGLAMRGNPQAGITALAEWWRTLPQAMREAGRILGKGELWYLRQFGEESKRGLEGLGIASAVTGERLLSEPELSKKAVGFLLAWTGRSMAAFDHLTNTTTKGAHLAVARALNPDLYHGTLTPSAADRLHARTQALAEITGGTEPAGHDQVTRVNRRAREILEEGVNPDVVKEAEEMGDIAAFQNDPKGVMGLFYNVIKGSFGLAERGIEKAADRDGLNPQVRAAMLIIAGNLRAAMGAKFIRFAANWANKQLMAVPGTYLIQKAGVPIFGGDITRTQANYIAGRNVVGLMVMTTLLTYLRGILDKDDDEEGWHLSGNWDDVPKNTQKELMSAGIPRLALWKREGGKITAFTYKNQPLSAMLAALGSLGDEKRYLPEQFKQHGEGGHLLRALAIGAVQIKDLSAVSGLADLLGKSNPNEANAAEGFAERLNRSLARWGTGFIPNVIKDADAWTDTRFYKPETAAEEWVRGVPILRRSVAGGRPMLNILGQPVDLKRAPWNRSVQSVETSEAQRVLGALLTRGLSLPLPSDGVTVTRNGKRVALDTLGSETVYRYQKTVGEGYQEWLAKDGAALLTMPVEQAEAVIRRRSDRIRQAALVKVAY